MLKSYFTTAWRNLLKNKGYSAINIMGLAIGLTVALLIGLWIADELSFDQYHKNYVRLAQVMDTQTINGEANTSEATAIPLADVLRSHYASKFKHIALVYPNFIHSVSVGDKKISASGVWAQPDFPEMLTVKMLTGKRDALYDPSSVLITRSLARSLFGDTDPLNRQLRLDNMTALKVGGVFEDLPQNTRFHDTQLILSWDKAVSVLPGLKDFRTDWGTRYWWLFVEMNEQVDIDKTSRQIKDITGQYTKGAREEIGLHPMSKWHLYNEFKNGKEMGGRIRLVWLFGIIGGFVLLLACINFMNLSTARSAKRAKEVGIRKAIGSLRRQLIGLFLSESVLVAFLSLLLAMGIVLCCIPFFNRLTQKEISIPVTQPLFWLFVLSFTVFTGLLSGSYPAFYLSAFRPVKVLKGNFIAGRFAALPRKILMVIQFTVSIMLIIATIIVYRQIQHAKDRPVGYTREGLITVNMNTMDIIQAPYNALRNELLRTGVVWDMAMSSGQATEAPYKATDFNWTGKSPNTTPVMGLMGVTHDFGNTIGWSIRQGRDFSRNFPTDSGSIVINEAAVKLTGLRNPIGEIIYFNGKPHIITGVVGDMIMESPYATVQPTVFVLEYGWSTNALPLRIRSGVPLREALSKIASVFKKYNPEGAFDYQFTKEEYARKFANEELISVLAIIFTVLAIFISCLGLSGLASFSAEQRTKEIGIRKVLGASVGNVWALLSKDFIRLLLISLLIASPAAYYFMTHWLQNYQYRTAISWWIFALTAAGALLITLLTVSYQSIKAALMNPTRSLKSF